MKLEKADKNNFFSDTFYSTIDFYGKLTNESNATDIRNLTANKKDLSDIFLKFINKDFNFIKDISQMLQLNILDRRRYICIILRSVVEQVI
ncbi:hypothetical protein, partial [Clostridium luticellarii]|uniref:hypothetical protein n=1 Tax=Clostridium luticellarii TaxID=1691940 RepID=UPI0011B25ECE